MGSVAGYLSLLPYGGMEQNIPRYIQPRYTEIEHDIEAHLHGELPAHDIELMDDY